MLTGLYRPISVDRCISPHWPVYSPQDQRCVVGVTYEVVSNIPAASEDLEDRESLAQMAASHHEQTAAATDGETYIEKYIRGLSAVDSILTLDRLRQVSVSRR